MRYETDGLVAAARRAALDVKPPEWKEGDKTFFYPTLENHSRYALHDHLIAMADTIESLTAERDAAVAAQSVLQRENDALKAQVLSLKNFIDLAFEAHPDLDLDMQALPEPPEQPL